LYFIHKTAQLVIPGLTRARSEVLALSSFFQIVLLLDAGSGLPSTSLGVRHDWQRLIAYYNYDTICFAGMTKKIDFLTFFEIINCNSSYFRGS
jgi:hypothetical protein